MHTEPPDVQYDAIVIGLGPDSCAAASEAAYNGLRVLAVANPDAEGMRSCHLRALRRAVESRYEANSVPDSARDHSPRHARPDDFRIDEADAIRPACIAELRRTLAQQGIAMESGRTRFVDSRTIEVKDHGRSTAPIIVIASGSRPRQPDRFDFDGRVVCDSETIFDHPRIPRTLLVLGAEGEGCELGCLFAAAGSRVTVVDRRRRFLRHVDRDLLELLHQQMQDMGIETVLEEEIAALTARGDRSEPHALIRLASGRVELCDRVVVAAGSVPNLEGMRLDRAGIDTDAQGLIVVDEYGETSQSGVYALGTVVASVARACCPDQGSRVLRHALGRSTPPLGEQPIVIRTIPEVSMVGLTDEMCRLLDVPCVTGVGRYDDPAWLPFASGSRGLLKLVVGRGDRKLLGVHAIGTYAHELAHLGALFQSRGKAIDKLAASSHRGGSLLGVFSEAALAALEALRLRC